ncbi:pesticidal protein (plasmid) [Bacillus thuringiensis]|nr:pesticidal protein [Bacillus thuringiensis]
MCQQNQQYGENSQTFASAETIAAVGAGIIVVGTILGALAFPPLGAAGIISFGTLLPIIWESGQDAKTVWKAFLTIGNRPFGSPVDQAIIEFLYTKVNGLKEQFEDYQRYFDIWNNNKTPNNAREVRTRFSNLDADIARELEQLKGNYYITLLPGYTQVANWHLILLNHAAVYYDQWAASSNLSIQSVYPQDYTSNLQTCLENCARESGYKVSSAYYKCTLKCRIEEYTNYCSKTYQEGLNILKNSSGINWNVYNAYRREMTLAVLDLIAIFPTYDREKYPISTKPELTREIYTDALLREYPANPVPIDQRENQLTRPPHLFTRLNLFTLYTATSLLPNGLHAVQNVFSYANDNTMHYSPLYQPTDLPVTPVTQSHPFNITGTNVYKILLTRPTSFYVTTSMKFYLTNASTREYSGGPTHPESTTMNFEFEQLPANKVPPNGSKYTNILSYIKIGPETGLASGVERQLSFAWTHTSVDFNNTISNNSITQISAVKAYETSNDSKVVKGPGHTGGDLVELKDYLLFKILVPQGSAGSYQVRIRYASNAPNENIILTRGFAQNRELPQTFNHSNYNDLKYSDFQYVTFPMPITYTGALTDTVSLYGRRNNPNRIFIDKIEFIPIKGSAFEYEGNQALERAEKSVDNLFSNK